MDSDRLDSIRAKQRELHTRLMRLRNVVGVGVGYKVQGGLQTDTLGISVSVTRKVPSSQLASSDLIPKQVDGVRTDVVRTGLIYAINADRRGAMRPARPGVSIGHYLVTAGTLGLLVRRDGTLYVLSNNHVLANVNQAQPGDPIYQPGTADGGTSGDKLAELADFVPLRFPQPPEPEPGGCAAIIGSLLGALTGKAPEPAEPPPMPLNQVDVALARPLNPALVDPDILDIGLPTGVADPVLGARVRKSGRTTGLTESEIRQVDVTADVIYGNQRLRFVNQVMTGPLSRPGDSGSAVVNDANRVVGLMYSGSDYVTLFTPIAYIMAALGVEVLTG